MKVTIEVESKNDFEKLTALLKSLDISSIKVISTEDSFSAVSVKKGDKKIDPEGLFGIWANNPRSLEDIRKDAWQRS